MTRNADQSLHDLNNPKTVKSDAPPYPAPLPVPVVPKHLRGTRAAIFHLLRTSQSQDDSTRHNQPTAVVATEAPRPRVRQNVASQPDRDIGLQRFLYGDQFEFRSAEMESVMTVRNLAMTHNRPTLRDRARKVGQ